MQNLKSTSIAQSEWRWVFIISGVLAALTLLPYAWALAANASATDWQFMGILANPQDGASYLAKIGQGMRGSWLLRFNHTPEAHAGAAIQVFYLLLGHLARFIGVSNLVIFHMARVLTTLFMYSALYQFGATIWARLRPRRLFFVLVSVGSGLGWLVLVLDSTVKNVPDVTVPEAYPLYAAYANPHFPLVIGCLALLAAAFVNVFRIDFQAEPTVSNGGLDVFILSLVAALVLPQAMVPLGGALVVYLIVKVAERRKIPVLELRWVAMFMLPAILMAVYYLAVVTYNPVMDAVWNGQVDAETSSPLLMVLAYGLLLLVAVPGLWRAIQDFEADGDQLMLIWLVVNFILVFVPFNQQRRFMTGLIIPVVFFAVRSFEDYWFSRLAQRTHRFAIALLVVLVVPSNVLALGVPLFGLLDHEAGIEQRLLVEHDYWRAMLWLAQRGESGDVVLSSPNIGLWIPATTDKKVVYGHPWETLDAQAKLAQVRLWYMGQGCDSLIELYGVRFVIVGPQELSLANSPDGQESCFEMLDSERWQPFEFDGVTVYERLD